MISLLILILLILAITGRGFGWGGPDLGGVLNIVLIVLIIGLLLSFFEGSRFW